MSGKQEKRARKAAQKAVAEYGMETQEIINKAITNWLIGILRSPLKTRIKMALHILRGHK